MITTAQLKNDTLQLFATAYPGYMTQTHREHARILGAVLDATSARLLTGPSMDVVPFLALENWDGYINMVNYARRGQWRRTVERALMSMDRTAHVERLLTLVRTAN